MRRYIFTELERKFLEAYLTGSISDETEISKIKNGIQKNTALLEDVYLYLRIRKTMTI